MKQIGSNGYSKGETTQPLAISAINKTKRTIDDDYVIASDENAASYQDVTISSGVTVTVTSGSIWTILS
jgi:hypothetical protein